VRRGLAWSTPLLSASRSPRARVQTGIGLPFPVAPFGVTQVLTAGMMAAGAPPAYRPAAQTAPDTRSTGAPGDLVTGAGGNNHRP
jgi:hypothetical protein